MRMSSDSAVRVIAGGALGVAEEGEEGEAPGS